MPARYVWWSVLLCASVHGEWPYDMGVYEMGVLCIAGVDTNFLRCWCDLCATATQNGHVLDFIARRALAKALSSLPSPSVPDLVAAETNAMTIFSSAVDTAAASGSAGDVCGVLKAWMAFIKRQLLVKGLTKAGGDKADVVAAAVKARVRAAVWSLFCSRGLLHTQVFFSLYVLSPTTL